MYKQSFDGAQRALDLLSRIGAEERVGDSLAADTVVLYTRKMRQLAKRAANGDYNSLTPEMVVRDLTDRVMSQRITRITARVEKSAYLFWLAEKAQTLMDSGSNEFGRYESAYSDLLLIETKSLQKRSDNTSDRKLKAFPDDAAAILEKAALTEKSVSLLNALLFIRANLLIGLRPTEWFHAQLIDYIHKDAFGEAKRNSDGSLEPPSTALEVLNAKNSSVRGNSDRRIILLDKMSDHHLASVRQWLQAVERMKTDDLLLLSESELNREIFGSMQRAIRRTFTKAGWTDKMLPSLYSTRHQAVANAKADGQTPEMVAALFGHSSTDTARRHYGKKYAGYTGRSMRAAPESILAVRATAASLQRQDPWLKSEQTPRNPTAQK